MNEIERARHAQRPPYWKGAHRDWRVWVAVCSMLAAMAFYVMSNDLTWRPRSRPKALSGGVAR